MAICLVVVVVLLVWIMPKMISMVSEDKLPLVTKILLKIKDFIMKDYILIIGIVASLIISSRSLSESRRLTFSFPK